MRISVGIFLIVAVLLVGSETAILRGKFADPAHPGKCVVAGLVLSPGQIARHPTSCTRIICGPDGATIFHTCGPVILEDGKRLEKNKASNADYPYCCERDIGNAETNV